MSGNYTGQVKIESPSGGRLLNIDAKGVVNAAAVYVVDSSGNIIETFETTGTALSNNQVTITTTSTVIVAASSGRKGILIVNQGENPCYIGTGTVTANTGVLLNPGESLPLPTDSAVYGITTSGTTIIGYLGFA